MADTRNNNMPGNYCLQQKSMQHILDYELYEHSQYGHAVNPAIPCVGYTPSHMPRNTLSNNPVEIESQLFGIGSCNLVSSKPPVTPELHTVPEIGFFARVPLIRAPAFIPDKDQRPFPIPE